MHQLESIRHHDSRNSSGRSGLLGAISILIGALEYKAEDASLVALSPLSFSLRTYQDPHALKHFRLYCRHTMHSYRAMTMQFFSS